MRKMILGLLSALGLTLAAPAFAQPPAVPALPDTERRTSYSISATTCTCSVNFALFNDSTDVDQQIEVWVAGTRYLSTDPTFGWSLSSVTGPLATIPRPITDAVLTFNGVQTGTVQIVGAQRPRRLSQFAENRGVAARDLNQALTGIIAQNREIWDKTNDVTGRAILAPPGETLSVLPSAASRASKFLVFDGSGNTSVTSPTPGLGNVIGPGSSTNNGLVLWNGTAGTQIKDLGSLGTTTTVYHGNAGGAGSFGAVVPADLTSSIGSFWTDITDADGTTNATIYKLRDRLFVDDGALGTGTWNVPNIASSRSGTAINSVNWNWAPREASILGINSWGEIAVVGMSVASSSGRSGDPHPGGTKSPIGVAGYALNDVATATVASVWGGYFEALHKATGNGSAFGIEIDAGHVGTISDITPFAHSNNMSVGLWNACGGSAGGAVTYVNCSAAIGVVPNGASWRKGIVFLDTALDAGVGAGGNGVAIEMSRNQSIRWVNSGAGTDSEIWGNASGLNIGPCAFAASGVNCSSAVSQAPQFSFTNTTADAQSALYLFSKNRAGGNTTNADFLGQTVYQGFANAAARNSASIAALQIGAVSGNNVPSRIQISTSNTAGQLNQTLIWDQAGHLNFSTSAPPTNSACTGFALGTGSSDNAGRVTYTSATTCTINFGTAYGNAPFCQVTPGTAASTVLAIPSITQLAVTFGTAQTTFTYQCFGS